MARPKSATASATASDTTPVTAPVTAPSKSPANATPVSATAKSTHPALVVNELPLPPPTSSTPTHSRSASPAAVDKPARKNKKADAVPAAAAAAAAAAAVVVAPTKTVTKASKGTAAVAAPTATIITPVSVPEPKTPRSKKWNEDESLNLHDFVKAFTNGLRKRIAVAKGTNNGEIPTEFASGIEIKDVRALNKLLNSLKDKVAPKPKGDRPPMNAYFYYQALRHHQINEKGLSPAETARIATLTKEQEEREEGSSLTPYMIKSRMFNEDEYKKFDAKKKAELDTTAKGFSLFKSERFADEEADKSKALPAWLALKDTERTGFEKRAKKVADDKLKDKETKAAAKEADKQAKAAAREAKAKAKEEARQAKLAAVTAATPVAAAVAA